MIEQMAPDQLQWVLDHNMQIRAGHRVQIAEAVEAWRRDRAELGTLRDLAAEPQDEEEVIGREDDL